MRAEQSAWSRWFDLKATELPRWKAPVGLGGASLPVATDDGLTMQLDRDFRLRNNAGCWDKGTDHWPGPGWRDVCVGRFDPRLEPTPHFFMTAPPSPNIIDFVGYEAWEAGVTIMSDRRAIVEKARASGGMAGLKRERTVVVLLELRVGEWAYFRGRTGDDEGYDELLAIAATIRPTRGALHTAGAAQQRAATDGAASTARTNQASPAGNQVTCRDPAACGCPWKEGISVADLAVVPAAAVPDKVASCPNQGRCEWRVIEDARGLVVQNDVMGSRKDPLPIEGRGRRRPRTWDSPGGARYVSPVEDGWIVGLNWGEFGAGLWWVSRDGSRHTKLSELAVIDLIPTPKGVVAPTALNDDGWHGHGAVLLLSRARSGLWKAKLLAEIGTSAWAATKEPDDSVLVATSTQLVRVTPAGEKAVLHTGRWDEVTQFLDHESRAPFGLSFTPRSLKATPKGDIYIGMTAAVVRLTPAGRGYREEWLTPRCP
jgi:hypothetical protein